MLILYRVKAEMKAYVTVFQTLSWPLIHFVLTSGEEAKAGV